MSGDITERRRVARTQVHKPAMIVFIGRLAEVDCGIRDLTALGAGIEITSGKVEIPARFELTLDRGRTYRKCRLVWQRDERLGAEFLSFPDRQAPTAELYSIKEKRARRKTT